MKDYYAVLKVSPSAPDEVIKAAYRAMAKLYHPDTTQLDKAVAKRKMQEINEAFQVLSDQAKRDEYDLVYKHMQHRGTPSSRRSYYNHKTSEQEISQKNHVPDCNKENAEGAKDQSKFPSKLRKFLHSIGQSVIADMQRNAQIRENAYMSGMDMHEAQLVRAFKHSTGAKRMGYCRALEDRGLLWRNSENQLVPTEMFKLYWNG